MRKLILIVHVSLDGFVAGPKGELDGFPSGEENLAFVGRLTATADAALLGRVSYALLNSYWPTAKDLPNASAGTVLYSTWYNNALKIVLSSSMAGEQLANTQIISNNVESELAGIKEQAGKDMLLFGSPATAQTFMQPGLIDEYWIFINPVIFGKGILLFNAETKPSKLTLLESHAFSNGEVALHYRVNR